MTYQPNLTICNKPTKRNHPRRVLWQRCTPFVHGFSSVWELKASPKNVFGQHYKWYRMRYPMALIYKGNHAKNVNYFRRFEVKQLRHSEIFRRKNYLYRVACAPTAQTYQEKNTKPAPLLSRACIVAFWTSVNYYCLLFVVVSCHLCYTVCQGRGANTAIIVGTAAAPPPQHQRPNTAKRTMKYTNTARGKKILQDVTHIFNQKEVCRLHLSLGAFEISQQGWLLLFLRGSKHAARESLYRSHPNTSFTKLTVSNTAPGRISRSTAQLGTPTSIVRYSFANMKTYQAKT